MSWNDFNSADEQQEYTPIPKGTLAKVRMTIRPGGYDDPSQGWTGGYATPSKSSSSVYLDAEFVVLEGKYARRKIWSLIGLHSPKGPKWGNQGRAFIKGILNSNRGLNPKDNTPDTQAKRRISGFAELDGVEFIAKIDIEKDSNGNDKNVIKLAITPDHKEYAALMSAGGTSPAPAPQSQTAPPSSDRPSWAQ